METSFWVPADFLKKDLRWLLVNMVIGFDSSSASDIVALMQNKIISKNCYQPRETAVRQNFQELDAGICTLKFKGVFHEENSRISRGTCSCESDRVRYAGVCPFPDFSVGGTPWQA
jgi:hypothetical protein